MVATVTLTPHPTDDPTPRVDVLLQNLDAACVTVTVYQVVGSLKVAVRDAVKATVSSASFYIVDFEVPLGVAVTYQAMQYNSAGTEIGLTPTASTQVNLADSSLVVIQDPLAPSKSVRVEAKAQFGQSYKQARETSVLRRGTDTIALMGELGLGESLPLMVQTKTDADALALAEVLSVGDVLVRSMPGFHVFPAQLYCVVPQFEPQGVNRAIGGSWLVWPVTVSEVSRTLIGIIEPVLTYARFKATYATYAAAKAVYSTYLEAKRNPPPEV